MASISLRRNQIIASALSKHLCLDSGTSPGISGEEDDIKSLYTNVLKISGKWSPEKENDEVFKWVGFAESFSADDRECFVALKKLNEELCQKSVVLGSGMTPSEIDVILFSVIYQSVVEVSNLVRTKHSVRTGAGLAALTFKQLMLQIRKLKGSQKIGLSNSEKEQLIHVMRWMDYIQHKEKFGDLFGKIPFEKPAFEPVGLTSVAKVETDSTVKKTAQSTNSTEKPEAEQSTKKNTKSTEKFEAEQKTKKNDDGKKLVEKKDPVLEKNKAAATETSEKDKVLSVSLLNIQVGLIRKAWKHPSADSLLVEEIDVGESKVRQVVSGLAKFCTPEDLVNRRVVLITNVKPGKLRDVTSEGLVLCASSGDQSVVEPLLPPEGAKIGERVSFAGFDGKPEDVLNPKKKQLEKITPRNHSELQNVVGVRPTAENYQLSHNVTHGPFQNLFTDEMGVATFKGIPFMTSGGPITSSIPKAGIK